jgi:hypothetical protein
MKGVERDEQEVSGKPVSSSGSSSSLSPRLMHAKDVLQRPLWYIVTVHSRLYSHHTITGPRCCPFNLCLNRFLLPFFDYHSCSLFILIRPILWKSDSPTACSFCFPHSAFLIIPSLYCPSPGLLRSDLQRAELDSVRTVR